MRAADNRLKSVLNWLKSDLTAIYPEREANNISQLLITDLFGWSRSDQLLKAEDRLSESEMLQVVFAKRELLKGIPYQYVVGFTYFYDLKFFVDSSVLIPRPETEELVHHIIASMPESLVDVLDIGTGSGCIPIALKKNRANWSVSACDISEAALNIAQKNAKENDTEVQFFPCDILKEIPGGQWDVIVSNPPYIPERDKASMHESVKANEPAIALFVEDEDPLIFYRKIGEYASEHLKKGGQLWFEIHEDLSQQTASLFEGEAWNEPLILKDLQGKNRMLQVVKA